MNSRILFSLVLATQMFVFRLSLIAQDTVHVWELSEVRLQSEKEYANPYTDVDVWIELDGPEFTKRIYGFWDGGNNFIVRFVANKKGEWSWKSASSSSDPGLDGKHGSVTAIGWTETELRENPLRRGFIRATSNKHALMFDDGTPYFAIGDTWFSMGADRFKWYDDTVKRPIGPKAGFKDYVRLRKEQGFNWINMIATYPNWMTDDSSYHLRMYDSARTTIRSAWREFGENSAKNMDNEGGRPFMFPGKVPGYENFFPDMDRINPEYFKYIDRKIAYLNENGFVPFMEAFRRDASLLWSKYYKWPESYVRFLQYFYARYHAYNVILGPVHLDIIQGTISPAELSHAIGIVQERYGPLPFGNLLSANANPSTLENWGDSSWVTLHQIGNKREHDHYWYLTEIFRSKYPAPALNGEPYYAGYKDARGEGIGVGYSLGADGNTMRDNEIVRSGAYGCFLSGGLAGHVYGAEGIWGGDIEPAAPVQMWYAFTWTSAAQMKYLAKFTLSVGPRYQELVPNADLISPNKTNEIFSYRGWAYCARTDDRNIFLAYFEPECLQSHVRGAHTNGVYRAQWYDPRNGTWHDANNGRLASNNVGTIRLPPVPKGGDWGLKLIYEGPNDPNNPIAQVQYIGRQWIGRREQYLRTYLPYAAILITFAVGIFWWRRKFSLTMR
ncbi:MAG TPA: DUF5060 domain-containing protein [Chryseolinea sp.]|nr:DUF5060 domain-containing protein [Chryseolinea sp.]